MVERARPVLRFHDLGPITVERGGEPVAVSGRRLTGALALLLVRPNQRVGTDALIEAVWSDDPVNGSVSTLESHLWRLRRLFEPDHRRGEPFVTIVHDVGGYRLAATDEQVDSLLFERWAGEIRDLLVSGQPDRALARCEQTLELWRGDPWTPHTDAEWAVTGVARLREIRSQVGEQRVEALLELGEPETALTALQPLLAADPLRDRLWEMSMLAAYRAGRTDQALDTYARARRLLIEETGIEPGPGLRELQAKVLDRDSSLDGPSPVRRATLVPVEPVEVKLPHRRTTFVGRTDEVVDLVTALSTDQLVTVIGPAGCGKTRLVIEVAHQAAGSFPDGVWFVDLSAANDDGQLLDVITSTLGLALPEVGSASDALRVFTRTRRMLLVLDNCEHLLDPVADLVDALLTVDSELTVLTTSREPLDLDIEHRWLLEPLPLPQVGADGELETTSAAVQLFLQRLSVAAPGIAIGPDQTQLATEICAAVDGLPLAIELAAGQARSFTLAEIAERVRVDPVGLSRIGRGSQRHHATLREAIELSAGTLSPAELAVHRAIAVVPGPFTADLAACLADLPRSETAAALANLVHRSMLTALGARRPGAPSRFSQLATIRAHGLGLPGSDRRRNAEERRDRWVGDLIADIPYVGHVSEHAWHARIDDDLAAVRATLQHGLIDQPGPVGTAVAARLGLYWFYRGMVVEWERWTGIAAASPAADPFDRLLAGCSYAGVAGLTGRGELHRSWMDELDAYPVPLSHDQKVWLGQFLLTVGLTTWITGDLVASQRAADRMRTLAAETGAPILDLLGEVCRLLVASQVGDPDVVLPELNACYQRARAAENFYASWVTAAAGVLACVVSARPAEGLHWSDLLLQQFEDLGFEVNVAGLELRGILLAMDRQPYEALRTLAWSKTLARRTGMRWPFLPSTHQVLIGTESALTAADREHAYREGAINPSGPRPATTDGLARRDGQDVAAS